MLSMEQARERVAKGAAHLDQVKPGWHNRIDVGTLTLINPCRCVIGQLVGSYSELGLRALAIDSSREAESFGFTILGLDNTGLLDAAYVPLQDAWIDAVADRRMRESQPAETPEPVAVVQ